MEEIRSAFKSLTRKPKGKRPSEKPRRRLGDNIRKDLTEIRINGGTGIIPLRIGIIREPL